MYTKKLFHYFQHPVNMGEMKNPDTMAQVGNPVCLPPEEIININSSIKQIKQVEVKDKVLGSDGNYHKVKKIIRRKYKGYIYNIKVHNLGKTSLTPDHHILAVKLSNYCHKYRAFNKYLNKRFIPSWYRADEITKGDFILYPLLSTEKNINKIRFDISIPKYDFKSKKLPEEISINTNFLRLIGYYLAEGSSIIRKCRGTVMFTFGTHEKDYIVDVQKIMKNLFGLKTSYVRNHHNSCNISFYSARLARFFTKKFGKGAENKHLPGWAMELSAKKQRPLISGLWRGDGYINHKRKVAKFVTISKRLAIQLKHLLLKQKIIFSFLESKEKGIHKRCYSIYIKEDVSLRKIAQIVGRVIQFPTNKINPKKTWFHNNFYFTPVWKIEKLPYDDYVYNLEVANNPTYVGNSLILHNCGDVMKMYLKIGKKVTKFKGLTKKMDFIKDVKFQTLGCAAAIATSSVATELVKGKTLKEAKKLTNQDIARKLGGLPPNKLHCSVLAVQALHQAIKSYEEKQNQKA